MVSISLCIIVKNEERLLEQCLQSVQGLADEIIIVDTGSTDSTKDIAKKFTSKVFDFVWVDDFSAARNESLKHATKEWILVIDADELILPEDHEPLKNMLATLDEETKGVMLQQCNYTDESSESGFVPLEADSPIKKYLRSFLARGYVLNPLIRLFRNNHGITFRNVIHELVEYAVKDSKIHQSPIRIHHCALLKTKKEKEEKTDFYVRLGRKKVAQEPDNAKAHYELAEAHLMKKEHDTARPLLERALQLDAGFTEAATALVYVYAKLKLEQEAVRVFTELVKKKPRAAAHFNLGIYYYDTKQYATALQLFAAALKQEPEHVPAQYLIGRILMRQKKYREAEVFFENVLKRDPDHRHALLCQGALAYREKDKEKAHGYAERIRALDR